MVHLRPQGRKPAQSAEAGVPGDDPDAPFSFRFSRAAVLVRLPICTSQRMKTVTEKKRVANRFLFVKIVMKDLLIKVKLKMEEMDSTHKEHFRNMVGNRMMQ